MVLAVTAFSPSVYVFCATAEIPLSYFLGWMWLGQDLTWSTFVGTGLISTGILCVIFSGVDMTHWESCCNHWSLTLSSSASSLEAGKSHDDEGVEEQTSFMANKKEISRFLNNSESD